MKTLFKKTALVLLISLFPSQFFYTVLEEAKFTGLNQRMHFDAIESGLWPTNLESAESPMNNDKQSTTQTDSDPSSMILYGVGIFALGWSLKNYKNRKSMSSF